MMYIGIGREAGISFNRIVLMYMGKGSESGILFKFSTDSNMMYMDKGREAAFHSTESY